MLRLAGKPVADVCREAIKTQAEEITRTEGPIVLAIILVGDDPASHVYKDRLTKLAASIGVVTKVMLLPAETTQQQLLTTIYALNADDNLQGILPMMPLPKGLDGAAIGAAIAVEKDVDCLNPANAGAVSLGQSPWAPCTPRAAMAILNHYGVELAGKHAVVVGRSNVVGKPMAMLLLAANATVTICHSRTPDLGAMTRTADVLVAAAGVPRLIKQDMVKPGAVVVDVGIHEENGTLIGDVDSGVADVASALTPVPGGVGTVSSMMVMQRLVMGCKGR